MSKFHAVIGRKWYFSYLVTSLNLNTAFNGAGSDLRKRKRSRLVHWDPKRLEFNFNEEFLVLYHYFVGIETQYGIDSLLDRGLVFRSKAKFV
jgi:hypothetical protein